MGCDPTVWTMTCSGSMPTEKRSTGRLAIKNLDSYDEGRGPIPGVTNMGLEVRGGWYRCTAETAGTHWLHAERSEYLRCESAPASR